MIAIDFFCGTGGLTKGLSLSGIEVIAGIDIDSTFKDSFEKNNPGSFFLNENLQSYSPKELSIKFPFLKNENSLLLFAGCAPCQAFSQQRKAINKRGDENILLCFGKFVKFFKPDFVLIENVKGIVSKPVFSQFCSLLENSHYSYVHKIINSADYGIPQNRKRLVLIASKHGIPTIPITTHGPDKKEYRTVRDTISKYPPIKAGEENKEYFNHKAANLSPINLKRIKHTPVDGGNRNTWPADLILECHEEKSIYKDVYGRMFWNKPSPTLTCKCNSLSNGRFGHPDQDRAISLREAAALQTFPDDYVFYGTQGSIAKQIGNAVPVELGKILGEHIQRININ